MALLDPLVREAVWYVVLLYKEEVPFLSNAPLAYSEQSEGKGRPGAIQCKFLAVKEVHRPTA